MIPRAAKLGSSFKGCAAYLLHDKRDGLSAEFAAAGDPDRRHVQTSERVAFVETVNLFTDDAQLAVAAMIDTARNAGALKKANGGRARSVDKPVYHYSLSWPREDTHTPPTREEMLEAAHESMKALGIEDRQAVLIAHTDEQHPHIHVMVNTVHPETGHAAKLGRDHNKLSRWAQKYDKERGQEHLCPQRVENNASRDRGNHVRHDAVPRQEYERRKMQDRAAQAVQHHTLELKPPSFAKDEMAAHWREYREERDLKRRQLKANQKPDWAELYKRQNKELKDFDSGLTGRIKEALKQPKGKRFSGAMQAVFGSYQLRRDMVNRHTSERQELSTTHNAAVSKEVSLLLERYRGGSLQIFKHHDAAQKISDQQAAERKAEQVAARQRAIDKQHAKKAEQKIKAARRVPIKGAKRILDAEESQQEYREAPRPAGNDVRGQFQHSGRKPPVDPDKVREQVEKKTGRSAANAKRTVESEKKRRERGRTRKPRNRRRDKGDDFGHEIDLD